MKNGVDHHLAKSLTEKQFFLLTREQQAQEFLDDLHKQFPRMYPKKERNDDKAAILKAQHKRDVIDSYVDKRRVAIAKQLNKLKTKGNFRYRTDQQIENLVPLWQEPKIKNKVKRGFKW